MKQIPIKNIKLLRNLDNFAETLYKMPHTFEALPKPDLSFATLKTLMADAKFVGYPKQHNYQSYEGQIAPLQVGQHKRRLRTEKYFFLKPEYPRPLILQYSRYLCFPVVSACQARVCPTNAVKNNSNRFLKYTHLNH